MKVTYHSDKYRTPNEQLCQLKTAIYSHHSLIRRHKPKFNKYMGRESRREGFSTSEEMYVDLCNRKMNYMLLNKICFSPSHHHLLIYNTLQALALTLKSPFFLFLFFEKLSSFRNEGFLKLSRIVPTLSLCVTMSFEKVHGPIILPDESRCGGRLCRPDHFVSSFLMFCFFYYDFLSPLKFP